MVDTDVEAVMRNMVAEGLAEERGAGEDGQTLYSLTPLGEERARALITSHGVDPDTIGGMSFPEFASKLGLGPEKESKALSSEEMFAIDRIVCDGLEKRPAQSIEERAREVAAAPTDHPSRRLHAALILLGDGEPWARMQRAAMLLRGADDAP